MWRINFCKNGTDKLHVDFMKTDKKSMLMMFRGNVKFMKLVGHGTLSKTPGMEAKICKNVKIIFICPKYVALCFALFADGAQTKMNKTIKKMITANENKNTNAAPRLLPPAHGMQ